MERFPTEIILDIAAYLDLNGDKLALASLATCSRKYAEIVQPVLFRVVCPSTNAQMLRLLLTLKLNLAVSAFLKELVLSATMELMTIFLLTEMLENGRLLHLEVFRFQHFCLPSGGTNRFPRLARVVACNSFFPALRVLEVSPYRLLDDMETTPKSTRFLPSAFPKLEELYLGGDLTVSHAILPQLRALQAKIANADLDQPFRVINLRYLCTHSGIVDFRYLEQLCRITRGLLLSLECSSHALWDLPLLLDENGMGFKWMGEAFPHLCYLGGVYTEVVQPEPQHPENDYAVPMFSQIVLHMRALRRLKLVTLAPPGEEMNPQFKTAIIAMLNAHSSLSSVTVALCSNRHAWNFPQDYEVHTEHSFNWSSTNVEIHVGMGKHELASSAHRWRTG